MTDKKKHRPVPLYDDDSNNHLEMRQVSSAHDCTGLIPSPPQSEEEAESYADLYSIPIPKSERYFENTEDINREEQ